MKDFLKMILQIIKHPGVMRILLEVLKTINELLDDNDNHEKPK
jgi:hypothetical protein